MITVHEFAIRRQPAPDPPPCQAQTHRTALGAGTVLPNLRVCAIRLQYRIGHSGPFVDLTNDQGQVVEYFRNETADHQEILGPFALPGRLLGQPYVQLLWRYHRICGTSGARAQLRLDYLRVADDAAP